MKRQLQNGMISLALTLRAGLKGTKMSDDRPILAPFNDGDPAVDAERLDWTLFIPGYFTARALAGDRLDPATGKVINITRKD